MSAKITFIGGKENGVDSTTLNGTEFPADKPVFVDDERLIAKAKTNRFFKVEEAKAKGRDDEDDGEDEENSNGDVAIPEGWRDMHHKKLIALARRLGGEGDALATRDGALAYIEERIAIDEGTNA